MKKIIFIGIPVILLAWYFYAMLFLQKATIELETVSGASKNANAAIYIDTWRSKDDKKIYVVDLTINGITDPAKQEPKSIEPIWNELGKTLKVEHKDVNLNNIHVTDQELKNIDVEKVSDKNAKKIIESMKSVKDNQKWLGFVPFINQL